MKSHIFLIVVLALVSCNGQKSSKHSDNTVPQQLNPGAPSSGDSGNQEVYPGVPKGIYNGTIFNLLNETEGLISLKDADAKALFEALSVKAEDSNGVPQKTGDDIICREVLCTVKLDVKEGQVQKSMNPGKAPKVDTRIKKSYNSENLHLERSVVGIGNDGEIKLSGKDAEKLFQSINLGGVDSTKNGNALITKKTRDLKCVKTTDHNTDAESVVCEIRFRQRNGEIIKNKLD